MTTNLAAEQITNGLRVTLNRPAAQHRGTCTGEVSTTRAYPENQARAEVRWDNGDVRWPLVSILKTA